MSPSNDIKSKIETSIDSARRNVGKRVDQIDRKLRADLDVRRVAAENAPQLVAAGVAAGIVLGFGLPKPLLRIVQIAVPVAIAAVVAKKIAERGDACDVTTTE